MGIDRRVALARKVLDDGSTIHEARAAARQLAAILVAEDDERRRVEKMAADRKRSGPAQSIASALEEQRAPTNGREALEPFANLAAAAGRPVGGPVLDLLGFGLDVAKEIKKKRRAGA